MLIKGAPSLIRYPICTCTTRLQWVNFNICIMNIPWEPYLHYLPSVWRNYWGRFKNAFKLLNLRALKFSPANISFNVWVRYFVWNFKGYLWNSTQNILPIHWKMRFLYRVDILKALRFKSSLAFLKCTLVWWLDYIVYMRPMVIAMCLKKKIN